MRLYSLGEVVALFAIDPVTLRRWMQRASITPHVDPSDHRKRYLDQTQLIQLAQAHSRVLIVPPSAVYTELIERIERLEYMVRSLLSQPNTQPPGSD